MPPPQNAQRRRMLADAAIEVLGTRGIHQLSHRAVDEAANVPPGTTTNYFKSREHLLDAVARRVVELQLEDLAPKPATQMAQAVDEPALADLIGQALHEAATTHRTRFLAMFELLLEGTRQPALLAALSGLATSTLGTAITHHRALGLDSSPEQVQALITLYGGVLFSLVTAPPGSLTPEITRSLARRIVTGAMS
jgi:AcrR family transcriptional regulator